MTGRRVATVLAAVAFAFGYVLLSGALLVRSTLLDDAVYTGALARADVYERLYTEVLVDPALADTTEQIVGRLQLVGVDAAEARTLATNALRWAVPPSRWPAPDPRRSSPAPWPICGATATRSWLPSTSRWCSTGSSRR